MNARRYFRPMTHWSESLRCVRILCFLILVCPDLDGYEVARRLRKIKAVEDVGLFALTGYGRPEDLERARLAGFDGHFVKPLDFGQLERTLAQGRSRDRRTIV